LVYSLEIVAALICADVPAGPTRRLMLDRLKQLAVMVANAAANGADVDDPVEVTSSDERNSRSVESDEGSDRHARTP
ncbi:MAG: hypothetical protein R3B99_13580, partial [Polyangiales bacterium]